MFLKKEWLYHRQLKEAPPPPPSSLLPQQISSRWNRICRSDMNPHTRWASVLTAPNRYRSRSPLPPTTSSAPAAQQLSLPARSKTFISFPFVTLTPSLPHCFFLINSALTHVGRTPFSFGLFVLDSEHALPERDVFSKRVEDLQGEWMPDILLEMLIWFKRLFHIFTFFFFCAAKDETMFCRVNTNALLSGRRQTNWSLKRNTL